MRQSDNAERASGEAVLFGVSRRGRGREARRGLQPGDVLSSLPQRGEVCSSAMCEVLFGGRAPAGESARRWARARRRTIFSPARCSACRRGRGRGGLQVHNPASWRCAPRCVSAWAKARWPAGPRPGVVAMSSSARVGVGEGVVACSSINFGRPGALLGSSVAFGLRFRGCRAKRLYVHMDDRTRTRTNTFPDGTEANAAG